MVETYEQETVGKVQDEIPDPDPSPGVLQVYESLAFLLKKAEELERRLEKVLSSSRIR